MLDVKTVQTILKRVVHAQPALARDAQVVLKIYQGRKVWSQVLEQKERKAAQWSDKERSQEKQGEGQKELRIVIARQQTLLNLFCQALPQATSVLRARSCTESFSKTTPEIVTDAFFAAQALIVEFSKKEQVLREIMGEELKSVNTGDIRLYSLLQEQERDVMQQIAYKCDSILGEAEEEKEEYWQTVIETLLAGTGSATHFMAGQTLFGVILALMTAALLHWLIQTKFYREQ